MPYHIKSTGAMGTGDIFYEGGDTWTQIYANRKQFSSSSDATAVKNTQVTRTLGPKSYTYTPDIYANSTVVTE
tara:strand:- start:28 stop:246 length:219 start_codon:yes stop_codon:yes gene_type:complete